MRVLDVQKDPVHKNRIHVLFPEVFSSFPYRVNVTATNALGSASNAISFEESNIGKEEEKRDNEAFHMFESNTSVSRNMRNMWTPQGVSYLYSEGRKEGRREEGKRVEDRGGEGRKEEEEGRKGEGREDAENGGRRRVESGTDGL